MITIRAGSTAIGLCLVLLVAGCSREQQDWRSAESADTIQAYGQFIQRHPESELATQARTRVTQLGEDHDWQHAGSADTVDAYREFLAQHPTGKWAQEARIRIENFSLGEQTGTDAASRSAGGVGGSSRGERDRALAGAPNGGAGAGGGRGVEPRAGAGADRSPGGGSSGGGSSTGAGTSGSSPGGGGVAARAAVASRGGAGDAASSADAHSGSARGNGLAAPGEAAVPMARSASPAGTAAATPTSPAPGAFGIQLGAFSTEAGANNEWHLLVGRFSSELQGLREHLVTADTPSGRIYRLQAVVGDEAHARHICEALRKSSQACVAVLPH